MIENLSNKIIAILSICLHSGNDFLVLLPGSLCMYVLERKSTESTHNERPRRLILKLCRQVVLTNVYCHHDGSLAHNAPKPKKKYQVLLVLQ